MVFILALRRDWMKKAFTLIELICILGIISIVFGIAYPTIKFYIRKDKLRMATETLINDLRYAKMYAMTNNNQGVNVRFENSGGIGGFDSYLIYNPSNMAKMTIKKVSLPSGVRICSRNEGSTFNTDNIVTFKPEGNVSPFACTIVIKDIFTGKKKYITLTIGFTRIMEVNEGEV